MISAVKLAEGYPAPAATKDRRTPTGNPVRNVSAGGRKPKTLDLTKIWDRFSLTVDFELLLAPLGAEHVGSKVAIPYPNGSYPATPSVSIIPNDGEHGERWYDHGGRATDQLVAERVPSEVSDSWKYEPYSMDGFAFLATMYFRGNFSAATRFLGRIETAPGVFGLDQLEEVLDMTLDEIAAWIAAPKEDEEVPEINAAHVEAVTPAVDSDTASGQPELMGEVANAPKQEATITHLPMMASTLVEAIRTGAKALVKLGGQEGGAIHYNPTPGNMKFQNGLIRTSIDSEGAKTHQQISDWFAVQVAEYAQARVDSGDSRKVERIVVGGATLVDVIVFDHTGRSVTLKGLEESVANSIDKIADLASDLSVAMPSDAYSRAVLKAAYSRYRNQERETILRFGHLGLAEQEDGTFVYLAPAGSVTAEGISQDFVFGNSEGKFPTELAKLGFAAMPTSPESLAALLRAIAQIGKPEVVWPVLFHTVGCLVPSGKAKSLMGIYGTSGYGKSWLESVGAAAFGLPFDSKSFVTSLAAGATGAGVELLIELVRDGVLIMDDYKHGKNKSLNERADAAIRMAAARAYGAPPAARSTSSLELKQSVKIEVGGLFSGELLPADLSDRNRIVAIELGEGDVQVMRNLEDGSNVADGPINKLQFEAIPAHGSISQITAITLQHVIRDHLNVNGFAATSLHFLQARAEYQSKVKRSGNDNIDNRVIETASVFVLGVEAFKAALRAAGPEWEAACLPELPTEGETLSIYQHLVDANSRSIDTEKPGARVIRKLRADVKALKAHLVLSYDAKKQVCEAEPTGDIAGYMGWQRRHGPTHDLYFAPGGSPIGIFSRDGRYVHLYSEALQTANEALDSVPSATLRQQLMEHGVHEGRMRAAEFPEGNGKRPKGITFPSEFFFGYDICDQSEESPERV